MNNRLHKIGLMAATVCLVVGSVGCKQTRHEGQVPDMIEGSLPVAIAPTLAAHSGTIGAVSRLTPSTTTAAGVFEPNDQVGLFLQDEHDASFSTINMCYTADASLVFVPATKVYYKTYYQHGIYAYFPYNAVASNAQKIAWTLKQDQTNAADRIACDFLSSSNPNIKPQQIDPNAPEVPMTFYHQMTNVVVRVKNGDGSPLSTDLTSNPVKVFLVERSSGAEIDLTSFTKETGSAYQACAISNRTKNTINRLANRIFLGHNEPQDVGATMFFEGIAIPETVVAADTLIKIQIGKDGDPATRVFAYIPQADDPIVTSGLTQGKEHIFDLTIQRTQLLVQGGEITDWGTGSTISTNINGGGVTSSRLIFELINENTVPNTDQIAKCTLFLDGAEYAGEVTYTPVGADKARLTCSINTGSSFPYWFSQAVFSNAAGTEIWRTKVVSSGVVRIKGNPLDPTYATVLGLIDVATKEVTPGS